MLYVRWALVRLDFEKGIQLPSLIPFCVFLTGCLDGLGKRMVIRDRMTLLVRPDNLTTYLTTYFATYFTTYFKCSQKAHDSQSEFRKQVASTLVLPAACWGELYVTQDSQQISETGSIGHQENDLSQLFTIVYSVLYIYIYIVLSDNLLT